MRRAVISIQSVAERLPSRERARRRAFFDASTLQGRVNPKIFNGVKHHRQGAILVDDRRCRETVWSCLSLPLRNKSRLRRVYVVCIPALAKVALLIFALFPGK